MSAILRISCTGREHRFLRHRLGRHAAGGLPRDPRRRRPASDWAHRLLKGGMKPTSPPCRSAHRRRGTVHRRAKLAGPSNTTRGSRASAPCKPRSTRRRKVTASKNPAPGSCAFTCVPASTASSTGLRCCHDRAAPAPLVNSGNRSAYAAPGLNQCAEAAAPPRSQAPKNSSSASAEHGPQSSRIDDRRQGVVCAVAETVAGHLRQTAVKTAVTGFLRFST